MPTTYRKNPTDRQQDILEEAAFEGGVPVHEDQKIRVVIKENGATEKTNHAVGPAVSIGKNAGVSMPWNDNSGKFMENVGKP